jgi:hypothetical protein
MAEKSDVNDVGVSDTVVAGADDEVLPPDVDAAFDEPELPHAANVTTAAIARAMTAERLPLTRIRFPLCRWVGPRCDYRATTPGRRCKM